MGRKMRIAILLLLVAVVVPVSLSSANTAPSSDTAGSLGKDVIFDSSSDIVWFGFTFSDAYPEGVEEKTSVLLETTASADGVRGMVKEDVYVFYWLASEKSYKLSISATELTSDTTGTPVDILFDAGNGKNNENNADPQAPVVLLEKGSFAMDIIPLKITTADASALEFGSYTGSLSLTLEIN